MPAKCSGKLHAWTDVVTERSVRTYLSTFFTRFNICPCLTEPLFWMHHAVSDFPRTVTLGLMHRSVG